MTLTEVINGIGQNTYALDYLSKFLGADILFGVNTGDIGPISSIAQAMMPAFHGLLAVIVLATIGTGIVKTATEGRFLGKNWHHVGTPAQLVLCIVLLAVSPANGLSFGQMIYARMLLLGNNFADVTWKDIVAKQQSDNVKPDDNGNSFKQLIAQRFNEYLPIYICDEQLKRDGFDKRKDYQSLRHDACGVPTWDSTNAAAASTQSATPTPDGADMDAIAQVKSEYGCFKTAFNTNIKNNILKWTDAANGGGPMMAPQINVGAATQTTWPAMLNSATTCVYSDFVLNSASFKESNKPYSGIGSTTKNFIFGSTSNPDYAYEKGWGGAALRGDLASQKVESYKSTYTSVAVPQVNLAKIPSSDGLGLTQDAMNKTVIGLKEALSGIGVTPNRLKPTDLSGAIANTAGTGLEFLGGAAKATEAPGGKQFFSKFGPKALNQIREFGVNIKLAVIAAKEAENVADTAKALPFVGGMVGAIAKGVLSAVMVIFSFPLVQNFLLATGLFLTSAPVIPQAIMMVAMFLWLLRAVTWFLMVPFAITIAAIPNTRVGHDAWKELFSIALTPVLVVLFYVVGSLATGVLFDMAGNIIFGYYFDHGLLALIGDLISGEAIARLFIFVLVCIAGFMLLSGLIIKGPDFIFRALQLRGNFGEMGDDLSQLQGRMSQKVTAF